MVSFAPDLQYLIVELSALTILVKLAGRLVAALERTLQQFDHLHKFLR